MTSVAITAVTNTVVVTEGDSGSTVVTVPVTSVVTATTQGPQGPAGAGAYVHIQSSASTTWTINHNFGFRPTVELLDTGGQEIDAEVSHPSINQTVVTLNPATAGTARLT
jgi:hypothetical protein